MNRRELLTTVAAGAALAALAPLRAADAQDVSPSKRADPWLGLKAGVATYSLRGLKLDAAIAAIQRVGVKYCSIKDIHLKLDTTSDQRKTVARQFRDAGIEPISCGVVTMENDEQNVRRAFEYARDIAVPVIVCSPHPDSFPILDKMVKEFDIKLAIHNHGPGDKRFPSPYDALNMAKSFDNRVGLCIDVGHTAKAGVDPADAIRKCKDRLYDVHLKDVAQPAGRGDEVELGRGDLNVPEMLRALLDIRFAYHVGFEHEKDAKDPVPGLAESVGYAKGVLSTLRPRQA